VLKKITVNTRRRPESFAIHPDDGLIMIVGNYGSGKTEVAVNLAVQTADTGRQVVLADLDIVNPYFRSREARDMMEEHGVRVVVPPGAQTFADLPIVVPEVQGMLQPTSNSLSLFDVGGDDVGARLLSSLREALGQRPYQLWQVINARRPFTGDLAGCLKMKDAIETTARLSVTGLVANSHLVTETTAEVIMQGAALAEEVAQATNLPLKFVTAMEGLADDPALHTLGAPILRLNRFMLPPWLKKSDKSESIPAGRPVPIGKLTGVT